MRSNLRNTVVAIASLILLTGLTATAAAAEPTSYELPAATHVGSLAITTGGTAWFVPSRGTDWSGKSHSTLVSVDPEGTVSERKVAGFSATGDVATGADETLWVAGIRGHDPRHEVFQIGHLSPAGGLQRRYVVGRGQGGLRSMATSAAAVWLIREASRARPFESVERIDITSGKVQTFPLPTGCKAYALDVAPDGTPWFTQKCGGFLGQGASSKTSLSRIGPQGKIIRRRIAARDYPVTLAVGPEGTVWFGAWRYYEQNRIGRLTSSGELAEFLAPKASPYSIATGPEGDLWLPGRGGLESIRPDGTPGARISVGPDEPTGLTRAPDGSLWYGLIAPNTNTGGGGSGLYIDEQIHNEAGFLGHLTF